LMTQINVVRLAYKKTFPNLIRKLEKFGVESN